MGGAPRRALEDRLLVTLEDGCDPVSLPCFAAWLIRLGRQLYRDSVEGVRRVVVLVVPDTRFVAHFVAIGAVEAAMDEGAGEVGFEVGEAVTFVNPETRKTTSGVYAGTEERTWDGRPTVYHVIEVGAKAVVKVPQGVGAIARYDRASGRRKKGPAPNGFERGQVPDWLCAVSEAYERPDLLSWLAAAGQAVKVLGVRRRFEEGAEERVYCTGRDGLVSLDLKKLLFWPEAGPLGSPVRVAPAAAGETSADAPVTVLDGPAALTYNDPLSFAGVTLAVVAPLAPSGEDALSDLLGRLQFHDQDATWVPGGTEVPPQVEWSCHLL